MLHPRARIAWASKGFELATGKLPHQVAREVLGESVPIAVLSGPTFAKEVGMGLPTRDRGRLVRRRVRTGARRTHFLRRLRAYTQSDIIGVEIGGAVKNVIAIATRRFRRSRLRLEQPRVPDHARARRDRAARRRARRKEGNADGTRRPRRPGADLHRSTSRATAASAARSPRPAGGPGDRGDRSGGRGLSRGEGGAHGGAAKHSVDMPICRARLRSAARRACR